jgi:poly(A) polymerase
MNFKEELHKYPILDVVARSAAKLGVEAYIIGGFVRDLILTAVLSLLNWLPVS